MSDNVGDIRRRLANTNYTYTSEPGPTGIGPWVDLVKEANRVQAGTFGKPIAQGAWGPEHRGDDYEEYEHTRIVFFKREHITVIYPLDEEGERILAQADRQLRERNEP